jgi:hypothetical protein
LVKSLASVQQISRSTRSGSGAFRAGTGTAGSWLTCGISRPARPVAATTLRTLGEICDAAPSAIAMPKAATMIRALVMRLVAALGRAGVDHWPRRPPPSPGNGHRCQRSRQACRTTIPRTHSRHGRRRPSVLTQAPLRNGGRLLPNDWPGNKRRALHFKPYAAHSRTRRARDREAKGVKKIAKR